MSLIKNWHLSLHEKKALNVDISPLYTAPILSTVHLYEQYSDGWPYPYLKGI
jgi:hypothetical protein